jgi:Integrase core domain
MRPPSDLARLHGREAHARTRSRKRILQGRTLTMADAETCRILICDRNTKWTGAVRECLREAGIRIVQTPYQAPNANAYAERFVRSIKEECLDRIIPLGERNFRRAVREYVVYYHLERNHQGLGMR